MKRLMIRGTALSLALVFVPLFNFFALGKGADTM